MDEPYQLQCLLEGLGGIFGHHPAVGGNGQQLLLALGIGAGSSLALSLRSHSVGILDQALALDDAGVPVIHPLLILLAAAQGASDVLAALVYVALQAHGQQLLMVAGGLAGHAVSQAHGDDIVVDALQNIGGQRLFGHILHGLALPIGQGLQNQLPVLRGDVIGIGLPQGEGIQLRQIELRAGLELRVQVRAAILVGRRADDQLVVHNQGGHMLHDVFDHFGPENGGSLSGEFLVCLRLQHQTLCGDAGAGVKQFVSHAGKPFIQHNTLILLLYP